MEVKLVACTNVLDEDYWGYRGAEHVCNMAAKTCVSEEIPQMYYFDDTYFFWEDEDLKSLKHALDSGHESVAEHAVFTFAVSGVSRALSHQLVRHRMASYSQQSQRYVSMRNFDYVMPKSIEESDDQIWSLYAQDMRDVANAYEEAMRIISEVYKSMLNVGIPEEDARYILPNACTTNIVITMNARQLRHFFALRCCTRAQWEIQALANGMLKQVKKVAPVLFENAGPSCVKDGRCPEGKKSCGRVKEVQ